MYAATIENAIKPCLDHAVETWAHAFAKTIGVGVGHLYYRPTDGSKPGDVVFVLRTETPPVGYLPVDTTPYRANLTREQARLRFHIVIGQLPILPPAQPKHRRS